MLLLVVVAVVSFLLLVVAVIVVGAVSVVCLFVWSCHLQHWRVVIASAVNAVAVVAAASAPENAFIAANHNNYQ